VQFFDRADLIGTSRDVRNENYDSTRLLLAEDGTPVGMTDVVIKPGVKGVYGYPDRTEIAYCISGSAVVIDLASGQERKIGPGGIWVAPPGSRFSVEAAEPIRLVCVFAPPITGTETGILDQ
jgi:L-ectoine synthase